MAEAEERAAAGFYEYRGDDGSRIQVQASIDGVTVAQTSQGAFGRGAAVLTADKADELALAITAAGKASRDAAAAAKEEKAETPAAEAEEERAEAPAAEAEEEKAETPPPANAQVLPEAAPPTE